MDSILPLVLSIAGNIYLSVLFAKQGRAILGSNRYLPLGTERAADQAAEARDAILAQPDGPSPTEWLARVEAAIDKKRKA